MEEYVLSAMKLGLAELFFLEHMELGIQTHRKTWLTEQDFDYYWSEGRRLQKLYGDRIRIGLGVELGYNSYKVEELINLVSLRPWDRIGISCHFLQLQEGEPHLNLLSRHKENIERAIRFGAETILTRYFKELTDAVNLLPGHILCHLDAPLRYVDNLTLTQAHYTQIEHLLAAVKKKNMALEINTSGYAIRGEPFPTKKILAMAIDQDISLVASSDAHHPDDVGRYFSRLPELLSSIASS